MIVTLILITFLTIIISGTAFNFAPHPASSSLATALCFSASDSVDDDDSSDLTGEDTILRINFSFDNDHGNQALAAVQMYTKTFPFAAVLPVQPLTYLPVQLPDGNPAVRVTFLRKPTAEKGGMDGGILFASSLVSEEDCDEDGILDNYKQSIQLTARRITKGQTVSKYFSEKQIIISFVKGLSESRGEQLLREGGNVEIDSVFHLWM